jgi:hypothetical protein
MNEFVDMIGWKQCRFCIAENDYSEPLSLTIDAEYDDHPW